MATTYDQCIANCIVVLTAGGESSRFKSVAGASLVQKAAYTLPNGETMIERMIKFYRELGLTHFLILVYHNADSVKNLLGDGTKLGVTIQYSEDPGMPVGRGGAIKHALLQGFLKPDQYLIVHNPDDQLVGETKEVLKQAIEAHLTHEARGALVTAVMVEGVRHEFTGFTIEDGFVSDVEMYPFISIPTHIGMSIFSPEVLPYFDKLFDLTQKTDFEAVLFPELKKEKKLAAHLIAENIWISVNDEKGLKKLLKALKSSRE
jgi:NDP-sugar pyrophosphorylase family protein